MLRPPFLEFMHDKTSHMNTAHTNTAHTNTVEPGHEAGVDSVRQRWAWPRSMWLTWAGVVLGSALIVIAALMPPWLSPEARALVMNAFASLCHQLPSRSLTVNGIAVAVCDRCLGIYGGFAVGVALGAAVRAAAPVLGDVPARTYRRLLRYAKYVLIGMLAPLFLDWVGPLVGIWAPFSGWTNTPISRTVTGGLLGASAGLLLVVSIARSVLQSHVDRQSHVDERGG
mgnify:FL=1